MSTIAQFKQLEELFNQAIVLDTEAQQRFVEDRCPESLKGRLRGLLARDGEDMRLGPCPDRRQPDLGPGARLGQYELIELIGVGGMGEVYRARDLALGGEVAVKLVDRRLAERAQGLLEDEVTALGKVQHPAIATLYAAGESDGRHYIAMELVSGETLRERLARGRLPADVAVETIARLAEGLVHAHAAGVLHRDVKPENIMLAAEGPKLLDFGIAFSGPARRPSMRRRAEDRTVPGAQALGTLAYMPPEQLRNEPLDARTDIYALGAVLYECLAGAPAFAVEGDLEVSLAQRQRPDVSGVPGPAGIASILHRCLADAASDRYEDAPAFLAALRRLTKRGAVRRPRIAVDGFVNMSGDTRFDWLGAGISDSVGNDLRQGDRAEVSGRERIAAERSQGREASALTASRRLACDYLLQGSYQTVGGRLRVVAKLVDVPGGEIEATWKLDGLLAEVFDIQDRLAHAVAEALAIEPSGDAGPTPRAPNSLRAYELYTEGRRLWLQLGKGAMDEADVLFRQTLEADPDYAAAFDGLAGCCAMRYTYSTDREDLEQAMHLAGEATRRNPQMASPHLWLGYARFRLGQLTAAMEAMKHAAELDPTNALAPYFAACILQAALRPEEALPMAQRALELDPDRGIGWVVLGCCHLDVGAADAAEAAFVRAENLERQQSAQSLCGSSLYLAEVAKRLGDLGTARTLDQHALTAIEKSDHMYRDTARVLALCHLAEVCAADGDRAAASAALKQAETHLRGRSRMVAGGSLLVRVLAGLAVVGKDATRFREASEIWQGRTTRHDFTWYPLASELDAFARLKAAAQEFD